MIAGEPREMDLPLHVIMAVAGRCLRKLRLKTRRSWREESVVLFEPKTKC